MKNILIKIRVKTFYFAQYLCITSEAWKPTYSLLLHVYFAFVVVNVKLL